MSRKIKKSTLRKLSKTKSYNISWEKITANLTSREEEIKKQLLNMSKLDNAARVAASKYRIN